MEKIKVYSKENCVQCSSTYRLLDDLGIEYSSENLTEKVIDVFREEGFMQAPVVDTGAEKWSGFRPDKIKELAKIALMESSQVD